MVGESGLSRHFVMSDGLDVLVHYGVAVIGVRSDELEKAHKSVHVLAQRTVNIPFPFVLFAMAEENALLALLVLVLVGGHFVENWRLKSAHGDLVSGTGVWAKEIGGNGHCTPEVCHRSQMAAVLMVPDEQFGQMECFGPL